VNTPPATTTSSTSTTSTTSSTGTTGSTYYINANYNGVNKVFTNLTVYRDESTADHYLLVVANNTGPNPNPKIEFNFKEPTIGWSDNLSYSLNTESSGSYVKFTNESGKVYSTINTNATQVPLIIQFTKFQYVKDGIIAGSINGTLTIDSDTTTIRVTAGKLNLISGN
jgi:hypothetical protein